MEDKQLEAGNGKPEAQTAEQKDFKIAEIHIRDGKIFLEGSESFWSDRCRAIGVLMFCIEIVKTAQMPTEEKKIITPSMSPMDFVRSKFKRKK